MPNTNENIESLSLPSGKIGKKAADDALDPNVLAVREVGNNAGPAVEKYLAAVGLGPGYPWCMAFVIYRLIQAAHELNLTIPNEMIRTGSTGAFTRWAKPRGLWLSVDDAKSGKTPPVKGDLVFFWFAKKNAIGHVGIVVEAHDWGVVTVEGNTGAGVGVDPDGQGVFRRQRTWNAIGLKGGLVRLPY